MKKILLLIISFFLISSFTYAEDVVEPKINNINYDGYIGKNSIININGNDLDKCYSLTIDDKKIKIISSNKNQIQYEFSENEVYYGKLNLYCNNDLKLTNYFSFPFIKSITSLDGGLSLSISGENFGYNATVSVEGGKFSKDISQNGIITGTIPNNLTGNNIYINVNGLKSNILKMDLKIPEISFIYSDNNFINGSKVTVYGKNLNYYNNSKLVYGTLETTNFNYNKDNGSISFLLDGDLGKKDIKIISGNYISNSLSINNSGRLPLINEVTKVGMKVLINGISERKNVLVFKGVNFGEFKNDISVYNGNRNLEIYSLTKDEIIVFDNDDVFGNGYYYVSVNGVNSNIFSIYKKKELPNISSLEFDGIVGDYRSIKVYVSNFDSEKDYIYLDGSKVSPKGCTSGMCRIEISKKTIVGTLSVGRGSNKNPKTINFDLSYDKIPYVDNITIKGDLKYGTKFEIVGRNFIDSSVSMSNFGGYKDSGQLDIQVSDGVIKGSIGKDFNINAKSNISISKYGHTLKLPFLGNSLYSNKLNGAGFIKEISSDSGLIKIGDNIKLFGKGFIEGDFILIGNTKILLNVLNSNNATFLIPQSVSPGKYNINIENNIGFEGNIKEIIVIEDWNTGKISFQSKGIDGKQFYTNVDNSNAIYAIELDNKIKDYYINKISFKVNNYNKNLKLGTFDLKINGIIYDTEIINPDGNIIFNGYYPIKKSDKKILIELVKKSKYIIDGTYNIVFDNDSLVVKEMESDNIITNIEKNSFYPVNLRIISKSGLSCVDSSDDNINCNKFLNSNFSYNTEDSKDNTVIENSDNNEDIKKQNEVDAVSSTQKVYNRIDTITLDLISKYDSLTLYDQLNKYKDLRFKINKIVTKYNTSPNKIFLEYFYTKIDKKYKTVFKSYILSKK